MKRFFSFMASCTLISQALLGREFFEHGKIDVGPIYLRMDIENNGVRTEVLKSVGFRANASIQAWEGLILKPSFMTAGGEANLIAGGFGVGWYVPVADWLSVTPTIAYSISDMDFDVNLPQYGVEVSNQNFYSYGFSSGVDIGITPCKTVFISLGVMYAWPTTETTIDALIIDGQSFKSTTSSKGPIYAAQVDYYFDETWSVNVAYGYQLSMAKEKNSMTAAGWRIGGGYFF